MVDVKGLRALLDAATARPWRADVWYGTDDGGWAAIGPHCVASEADGFDDAPETPSYDQAMADAALIAAAVNALPELLDEVERLDSLVSEWASASTVASDRARATIRKLEVDINDLRLANPTGAQMIAMQKELARLQSFIDRTVRNAQLKIERLQLDVAAVEIERDALRARKAELCSCVRRYETPGCDDCGGTGAVLVEAP